MCSTRGLPGEEAEAVFLLKTRRQRQCFFCKLSAVITLCDPARLFNQRDTVRIRLRGKWVAVKYVNSHTEAQVVRQSGVSCIFTLAQTDQTAAMLGSTLVRAKLTVTSHAPALVTSVGSVRLMGDGSTA